MSSPNGLAPPGHFTLLPRRALVATGRFDHAGWNYLPVLGTIQRVRFGLVEALLPETRVSHLLELGYGSGVFLPGLAERCDTLHGIDVHDQNRAVMEILARSGVRAELRVAGAEALPFADRTMDLVVAVSSVEFFSDLDAACHEVRRVLRRQGRFVVVTPGRSPLVDAGLKVLTGQSAGSDYGARRECVLPTLSRHFTVEREVHFPPLGGRMLRLYDALRLAP
jgi:ubiquinone/menaquinone biosynthesis C-methylase UbiE